VDSLKKQHVLILGLGLSGLALARWCARCGAKVTVADSRSAPPQLAALRRDVPDAEFVNAAFDAALVETADFQALFKSPGLSPMEVGAIDKAARARGLRISGELGLFSAALAELSQVQGYRPCVLAITGTNGKTTVTSLTGQLVERAGKTVAVAGNIGPTLLDTLSHKLDAASLPDVWVLELSSFQLDAEKTFVASTATVLNITQDHLDWHGSMPAYVEAKANIFGHDTVRVLNRDDSLVMTMLPPPLKGKSKKPVLSRYVTFGADLPARPGDYGIEHVNGMVWLVRALQADATPEKRKGQEPELHLQRLMPVDALRIRGRHNAVNALAALALASEAGCALGPMLYGLREYRGEPHRVESIGSVNGIEYFDDSKGTNVGATVAALNGLGVDRKLVVIMGGQGKGQDFAALAEPVSRYARAVVLIGRDAPLIRLALQASGCVLMNANSMSEAVALANQVAQTGDAVLMSPACASFDMFDDYQHRARTFAEAVRESASANGVELGGKL
jgi:UDP-N-acetylmuramoylalanine--D-glutamate ligase